jgi:hypothetical protein
MVDPAGAEPCLRDGEPRPVLVNQVRNRDAGRVEHDHARALITGLAPRRGAGTLATTVGTERRASAANDERQKNEMMVPGAETGLV